MRARFATIALVLTTGLLVPSVARVAVADPSNRNPAAAQALYDEARRLSQGGKYADACPKFKESYQLDPGGGTLLNLADCYEKQGKTALAWTTFKDALVVAQRDGRNDRVEFATQHIASLEKRLARLTVQVSGAARVPGLSISLDGAPLGDAAWGLAMPVDPGGHVVRAEAPGKVPFEASIDVAATASRVGVDVPALADAPVESAPVPESSAPVPVEGEARGSNARATVGWIVGGVGVASVGVASYFGLHAFSRWSDRNGDCAGGCTADAKTAGSDANQAATISDIAFGVGLAGVAVGTYLVLSGHRSAPAASQRAARFRVAPRAVARGGALVIGGDW